MEGYLIMRLDEAVSDQVVGAEVVETVVGGYIEAWRRVTSWRSRQPKRYFLPFPMWKAPEDPKRFVSA